MKDDTEKHVLIGKIENRLNQFRTTSEPNINSYLYEAIRIDEPFGTIIVKERNFSL